MLWTTCAAVITLPSAVTSTPEPVSLKRDWPLVVTSRPRALIPTTLALTWSKTSRTVWALAVVALDMRVIAAVAVSTTAINRPFLALTPAIVVLLSLPVAVEGVPRAPGGPDKSTTTRASFPALSEAAHARSLCLSRILGGPLDQDLPSACHGLTAVTHGMLSVGGHFRKRGVESWVVEDGIVTEPAVAAWRIKNQPVHDALGRRLATVGRAERDHAAVSRSALRRRNAAQLTEHQ